MISSGVSDRTHSVQTVYAYRLCLCICVRDFDDRLDDGTLEDFLEDRGEACDDLGVCDGNGASCRYSFPEKGMLVNTPIFECYLPRTSTYTGI